MLFVGGNALISGSPEIGYVPLCLFFVNNFPVGLPDRVLLQESKSLEAKVPLDSLDRLII